MNAITISRQMGSMGCQVAEETARRLDWKMVWREVVNDAALRAGVPEMALATIDELGLLGIKPPQAQQAAYLSAVDQVLHELVEKEKIVIIGRAGQVVLKSVEGVLHVRIVAPLVVRIKRTAEEMKIPNDAAQKLIERSDRTRKQYLKRYYQTNIDEVGLYDLVINTERVGISEAAASICAAVKN